MFYALKSALRDSVARTGLELSYRRPQRIAAPDIQPPDTRLHAIASEVVGFFGSVPPFYGPDTPAPLQIGGAWRADLLERRRRQMALVAEGDAIAYASLLGTLFRSELVAGLWNYRYFSPRQRVDARVYADLDDVALETGRLPEDLADDSRVFGEWGLAIDGGVVKYTDPMHAAQASRVLAAVPIAGSVVWDIGSGFGGMARYLTRWTDRPLTVVLLDIPLNLTTAYAYLRYHAPEWDVRLIACPADLTARVSDRRILCVPTVYGPEARAACPASIIHNAQSFSEMDAETVAFYLAALVAPETRVVIETNAARPAVNSGGHREVSQLEIATCLSRAFTPLATSRLRGTRYTTTTFLRHGI